MDDLSHLDRFYLSGPVTPMSSFEHSEYQAWKADYLRRIQNSAILENMATDQERLERLEAQIRDQAQIIDKLQNMLRIAANYKNEDIGGRLDGVQAALLKAGEVKARDGGRRR